ncbi:hypothetical protein ACFVYG_30600 [Streptomyces sp. NPDC058256]
MSICVVGFWPATRLRVVAGSVQYRGVQWEARSVGLRATPPPTGE